MPKFHFHIRDQRDETGQILPSLEAAKCEAVQLTGRTICDEAEKFWDHEEWVMIVTDEAGFTLSQLENFCNGSPHYSRVGF